MTKIALVFPGQGSQRQGMLENIPENEDLDRLFDAAEALAGLSLCAVATDGPDSDLADTRIAQPLLYLTDWAWGVALIESGVEPVALAGHSLGEFAALAVAGVFSVEAGLQLVVERSKLMANAVKATPGTMAAILGLDGAVIGELIKDIDGAWMANDNAPGQVVISGTVEGVEKASGVLSEAGARKVVPLNVAGPFHSPLMEPARDRFAEILMGAEFADATVPVYQNTGPSASTDADVIRERLIRQITEPVRWTETMTALAGDGVSLLVESGPGTVLTGLARRVDGLDAVSAESAGIESVLEKVM